MAMDEKSSLCDVDERIQDSTIINPPYLKK